MNVAYVYACHGVTGYGCPDETTLTFNAVDEPTAKVRAFESGWGTNGWGDTCPRCTQRDNGEDVHQFE